MERVTFLKPFGAAGAPWKGRQGRPKFLFLFFFYRRRRRPKLSWRGAPGAPNMGRPQRPNFFFIFLSPPPKAVVAQMGAAGALTGALKASKGGAEGATLPEGEGNPAEGWYFASIS